MASNPFFEQETLTYWFTDDAMGTRPTEWYVALHSGDPGTGADNELTDANYARQPVVFEVVPDGDGYVARNVADLVFPALAASANVLWVSIKSAASGGSHIRSVAMPIPKAFDPGGIPRIPAQELVFEGV